MIEPRTFTINGRTIDLVIRPHPRAKSLKLRCDPFGHTVFMTIPKRTALKHAMDFFDRSHDWLTQQLARTHHRIEFKQGAEIPILGTTYRIHHHPARRTRITLEDKTLYVEGDEGRTSIIVHKWLRFHALGFLQNKSLELAENLGLTVNKVKIRDLKSLWGSCSGRGDLTYSWRLIIAPPDITHYICAHEVSHLKERNHGPRFWSLVESVCPHYKTSRHWLRSEGRSLFRYG